MPTKSRSQSTSGRRAPKIAPVHPGAILRETIEDLGLTMNQLATAIRVPANRINAIVAGQRSITGETAIRLGRYFGTTAEYWLNLQSFFDLESARDRWEEQVAKEVQPRSAA